MSRNLILSLSFRLLTFLLVFVLALISFSPNSEGLASGPVQLEFKSFTPADASNLVDLFTGNFRYNIPLIWIPAVQGILDNSLSSEQLVMHLVYGESDSDFSRDVRFFGILIDT